MPAEPRLAALGAWGRRVEARVPHPDWVLAAVAGVPILVAVASLLGQEWWPTSDRALEMIQIRAVGTADTPILGPWSRYGWSHPGPLLFWVAKPGEVLFGSLGVLATTGLVNLSAVFAAVLGARRLGGWSLALLVAASTAVLIHSGGSSVMVDVWNPYVGALPLVAFLICGWAAAQRGVGWCLVVAVLAGSYAAQAHVSSAPAVIAGSVLGVAAHLVGRRSDRAAPLSRRALVAGVAVGLVAWSGPIGEQLTARRGNLWRVADFFITGGSPEPTLPLDTALGVAARELGAPAAWMGGGEVAANGVVAPGQVWTVIALAIALAGVTVVAKIQARPHTAGFAAYAAVLLGVSVLAITRVSVFNPAYLFRSNWAVSLVAWVALAWGVGSALVASPVGTRAIGRRLRGGGAVLAMVVLVTATVASIGQATPVVLPASGFSEATGALLGQVRAQLAPGRYAISWLDDRYLGSTGIGLGTALLDNGYDISFPSTVTENVTPDLGSDPDARPPATLLVAGPFAGRSPVRPDGARRIASYVPASSTGRDHDQGGRYLVWLVPPEEAGPEG